MRKRFTADYYGHERYHGYASLPENALPLTRRELFYLGGGVAIGALTSCALNLLLPNDDCSSEMQLTTQASNTSADNTTQDSAEPVTLESLPWNLQLVNKSHYLEDENAIGELKVLPDKSWTDVSRGLQVDSRILESLCSMMDAAQKEGVSPLFAQPIVLSNIRRGFTKDAMVTPTPKQRRRSGWLLLEPASTTQGSPSILSMQATPTSTRIKKRRELRSGSWRTATNLASSYVTQQTKAKPPE